MPSPAEKLAQSLEVLQQLQDAGKVIQVPIRCFLHNTIEQRLAKFGKMAILARLHMNQQCLDRRIPDWQTLTRELAAWEKGRKQEKASIKWLFNIDKARNKLNRAYEGLNQSNPL